MCFSWASYTFSSSFNLFTDASKSARSFLSRPARPPPLNMWLIRSLIFSTDSSSLFACWSPLSILAHPEEFILITLWSISKPSAALKHHASLDRLSKTDVPSDTPVMSEFSFSMSIPSECMVPTHTLVRSLSSEAPLWRSGVLSCIFFSLCDISPAAFLVNVMQNMSSGRATPSDTSRATRSTMTRVLPDPGPPLTSSGPPPWPTTLSCSSVSSMDSASRPAAPTMGAVGAQYG